MRSSAVLRHPLQLAFHGCIVQAHGINVVKLMMRKNKLRMFFSGKPFQDALTYTGKARSLTYREQE
jgi:hypothetical protein